MPITIRKTQLLLVSLFAWGLIFLNSYWFHNPILGIVITLVYFLSTAGLLFDLWKGQDRFSQLIFSLLTEILIFLFVGGILVNVSHYSLEIALATAIIIPSIFYLFFRKGELVFETKRQSFTFLQTIVFLIQLGLIIFCGITLWKLHSDGYVFNFISLIPQVFWWAFFGLMVIFFSTVLLDPNDRFSTNNSRLVILTLINLLIYSTVVMIFAYMYGTDSWRHLTMERGIYEGTIQPLGWNVFLKFTDARSGMGGFWSFVPTISWLTSIRLISIWRWLNPIMAAFLMPLLYYSLGKIIFNNSKKALLLAATTLIIAEISRGMLATPGFFGIMMLVFTLAICLAWLKNKNKRLLVLAFFAVLGSLMTYPTAGITALLVGFFTLIVGAIEKREFGFFQKLFIYIISFLTACIILVIGASTKSPIRLNDLINPQTNLFGAIFFPPLNWPSVTSNLGFTLWLNSLLGIFGIYYFLTNNQAKLMGKVLVLIFLFLFGWVFVYFSIKDNLFLSRLIPMFSTFVPVLIAGGAILLFQNGKSVLYWPVACLLVVLFSLSVLKNYNQPIFAISASKNEVEAVQYLNLRYENYLVLSDELTEAVGSALAGNNSDLTKHYDLYGSATISESFNKLIKNPSPKSLADLGNRREDKIFLIFSKQLPPFNPELKKLYGLPPNFKENLRTWAKLLVNNENYQIYYLPIQ